MLSTCAQHFFNTNWNFYYTENHTFFFVKSAVTYLTRFLSQFWTDFQTFFRKSRLIHSSRYVRNRFDQFNVDKFLDSNLILTQPLQNVCFWTHIFFQNFQHLTTQLSQYSIFFQKFLFAQLRTHTLSFVPDRFVYNIAEQFLDYTQQTLFRPIFTHSQKSLFL